MSKLVSAVITTYKRPVEIVFRALESVLNQTYSNIEVILVDDSPETYDGRIVLQKEILKYSDRIKYIQNERNMGACASRNVGLHMAKGDYIAFLDDDDEWLPEKIEHQMNKFIDPDVGLVYCGRMIVNDSTGQISNDHLEEYSGYVFDKLIFNNFIGSTSYPLIKRESLVDVEGFDPLMRSAQDYDVWLRLAKKCKVDFVNIPLVKYHIHEGERISTNFKSRISGQERLIEKNKDYLIQNPKAGWWRLLRLSMQCSKNKQLMKALKIWTKACTKQPFRIVVNMDYLLHIIYYCFKKMNK